MSFVTKKASQIKSEIMADTHTQTDPYNYRPENGNNRNRLVFGVLMS
jgi:hypothetical protein